MENNDNNPKGIVKQELEYTPDKQHFNIVANRIKKIKDELKGTSEAASELIDKGEGNSPESEHGFYKGFNAGIDFALTAIQSFQLETGLYTDKDTDLANFKEKQKR